MPRHIAFLRAINVGGHTVKMDQLRTLFEELGLKDVETFIASGNVIFRSPAKSASLESKIERHLHRALGYEVDTFIRTDGEVLRWRDAASCTLSEGFWVPGGGFLVTRCRRRARILRSDGDRGLPNGAVVLARGGGQSDSTLNGASSGTEEGHLRNINTVMRLAARYPVKGT
jgi:hypothetical protein